MFFCCYTDAVFQIINPKKFLIMNKVKAIFADLARVYKLLPFWGQSLLLASMVSWYVAVFPTVDEPKHLTYQINGIAQTEDGEVRYSYLSRFTDEFPDEYINTSASPEVGDMVIILREKGEDEVYFYRDEPGKKYPDWRNAVWDYKKDRQREVMVASFLFSISIALASYPGLITRLWDLIPKH